MTKAKPEIFRPEISGAHQRGHLPIYNPISMVQIPHFNASNPLLSPVSVGSRPIRTTSAGSAGPPSICPPRSCSRLPPDESSRHPSYQRSPARWHHGLIFAFLDESKRAKNVKFGAGLEYYLPAFTQNGRHENWWKPEPSQSKDSNAAMPRSRIHVSPKVVSPLLVEIEHPRKNCGSENGM